MGHRTCVFLACAAFCAGVAFGQTEEHAAADPSGTQVTPAPPRIVPFGTAHLEYREALRRDLDAAMEEKAAALREGRTAAIGAIDARIAELRRRSSELEKQMELAGVPDTPPTPPPHSRAASSTNP
jgi:hypothetical protein